MTGVTRSRTCARKWVRYLRWLNNYSQARQRDEHPSDDQGRETAVSNNFLESYLGAFDRIEGWFSPDAALMLMAYNEVITAHEVTGDVLEIGVHHGLSAIALSAMRNDGARLVAIDLFEQLQDKNNRPHFVRNMTAFFGDLGFVRSIAAPSSTLGPADVGDGYAFCHVDGGHTATETYKDLDLCSRILAPGGLLALDDYFNPAFPGVCEGAVKFWLDHDGAVTPVAAGFNKVLFQKAPARFDLNEAFNRRFPYVPHKTVTLWETPIHSFSTFAAFIDTRASSPRRLVPNDAYELLIPRVRTMVEAALPPGAVALVVSRGDGRLLAFNGRTGWHFLRSEKGLYAGHHPADSAAAIEALELLRADGARYLVFPQVALWWLDHYAGLREHLDRHARVVVREDRKSTRLNSSHSQISYAVFCLKK